MKGSYLMQPAEVEVGRVGSATDVILRKNIEACEEADEHGTATVWKCDEVQGRVAGALSAEDAAAAFDTLWAKLSGGQSEPSAEERLAALEDAMMAVMGL